MIVEDVIFTEGVGGYFYDDQKAIGRGAVLDGERYPGEPVTPGFTAIRMPAATIGVGLVLASGCVVWGDSMSVQYAGAAGRDPVLTPADLLPQLRGTVTAGLRGLEVDSFRAADALAGRIVRKCGVAHTAVDYGISQALLAAAATTAAVSITEVLCEEYSLPLVAKRVPIYSQSGENRRGNVDKMIAKGSAMLPHGLINTPQKFGTGGATLLDYVDWLRRRILDTAPPDFRPTLHVDVYGMVGQMLGTDSDVVATYLSALGAAARPFRLRVESPVDFGSRDAQVTGLAQLRQVLADRGIDVEVVADEWCNSLDDVRTFAAHRAGHLLQIKVPDLGSLANTMDALIVCRDAGMPAILGGSCTETDVSARVCVHVAVATQPPFQLAKPGMGVDEGFMVVHNEQERLVALLARRLGAERGSAT